MNPASRTPEGWSFRCPVCGGSGNIEPTSPPGDAPCPRCGCLLWPESPSVSRLDFLVPEAYLADLGECTQAEAIQRMVEALALAGAVPVEVVDDAIKRLLEREQLGSTGIGRGVAVPHAFLPRLQRVVGCLARSTRGIHFASLDGEPVHRLVLLLSPSDQRGSHLRALQTVCDELLRHPRMLP